jgi:hypothetical protein
MAEKRKAQLHEVLAVEQDLKNAAKKVIEEGRKSFKEKPHLFTAGQRKLSMFDEDRKNEEEAAFQYSELTSTVNQKIDYIKDFVVKALDATMQKEVTNQNARADIEIDGDSLVNNVPATMLLTLEKEMIQIRNLYEAIPTLQNGMKWVKDESAGKDIWKMGIPEITNKTEKKLKYQILVPATKEHPAQVEKWNVDEVVGRYEKTLASGMITSARKAVLLGRIDGLIRAIKKARTRANKEEVKKVSVGKVLFDYINA